MLCLIFPNCWLRPLPWRGLSLIEHRHRTHANAVEQSNLPADPILFQSFFILAWQILKFPLAVRSSESSAVWCAAHSLVSLWDDPMWVLGTFPQTPLGRGTRVAKCWGHILRTCATPGNINANAFHSSVVMELLFDFRVKRNFSPLKRLYKIIINLSI